MNAICIYKEQTTQLRKESKITKKFGEEESYCVVPQISFDITASKRKTNDCVIDNTQNHFYIANVFKLKMNQRKVIDMQNNRSNLLTKHVTDILLQAFQPNSYLKTTCKGSDGKNTTSDNSIQNSPNSDENHNSIKESQKVIDKYSTIYGMINKILLKMITQFLRKRIIRDLFSDLNLISLRNILKTHIVKIIIDEDISRLDKSIINRKRQRDEHSNLKKEF